MAQSQGPRPVKVGVLLGRQPDDLGEWLALGAAFDVAGADALWVDVTPESELDPLVLTVALVAVTHRSLVVTTLPPGPGTQPAPGSQPAPGPSTTTTRPPAATTRPSTATARALATIARLSRGRLRILVDDAQLGELGETGHDLGVFRRMPGDPEVFEHTHRQDEAERWVSTPAPESRATWRATVLDATERGTQGLLVPADPRLLDLLRNPGDPGDRHDLQLAHG